MKLTRCALLVTALALPLAAQAEQFYAGYSYWDNRVSGTYRDNGVDYDINDGLAASTRSRALYRLRWDTPTPWLPDLAASYGRIVVAGQRTVTSGGIGGLPIGQTTSTADVDADVSDIDATLRYGLALDWARISLGVTVKQLKGDIDVNNAGAPQSRRSVDQVFPMAHLFAEVPFGSRVRLGVGGDWISAKGDAADNILAMLRVKLIGPLDITGGWQRKHYKVDSNGYFLDATLQGWQVGGELAF